MPHEHGNGPVITLTDAQVEQVVRCNARRPDPTGAATVGGSPALSPGSRGRGGGPPRWPATSKALLDRRLSQSLVRGLSLLCCFDEDGAARGIVEVAGELQMSPSTAHRYALTLVELGLLERCPDTRKYRLPA